MAHRPSARSATIAAVAFVGALALLVVVSQVQLFQGDTYKALYDGRWIASHGIPHTEAFAVAARHRWIDEEWLAELIIYEIWTVGGYALVAIIAAGSIAAAYVILAGLLRHRGVAVGWAILLALAALFPYGHNGWAFIRARDLVLPLSSLLFVICLTDNERPAASKRLVLLIPLLVLWANLHGSVLLAAALALTYVLYRAARLARGGRHRDAAASGVLAFAVALTPLANPYGIQILDYYREFVGNAPMRRAASEWIIPGFPSGSFFELYVPVAIAIGIAIRCARRRQPIDPVVLGAVAITAVAASLAIGNVEWCAIALAVLVGDASRSWMRGSSSNRLVVAGLMSSAVLGVAVVTSSLATRTVSGYEGLISMDSIDSAAMYASTHPCARILADNLGASALLWHDPWLAGRIEFDARYEQFPPPALMRWLTFESAESPQWLSTSTGYQLLIGDKAFSPPLVQRLQHLAGARVLASDHAGIALVTGAGGATTPTRCGAAA